MKFYLTITKNEIPENDRAAWLYLFRVPENELKKGNDKVFLEFVAQLERLFPNLPTKMVWGNYLISEVFERRISLSVDFEDKSKILAKVLKIAKEHQLVVFDPKPEKIYRPQI